jgi:dTDP-4-amino-4,6-dideoxygalactose transaminase
MIKLIKPYLDYAEVEADFKAVFASGMFTKGENVSAFMRELGAFTGAKYAYLATSATTALWVCLKALDIQPGDEVIVSDFSFPATANVVEDLGAIPVFADVCEGCYNMRPEELERRITKRTKAVIVVDALGNPTGMTKIKSICAAHGIPLIEDAACAIGSSEHGVPVGNIADMTCFSFHPRKLLSTGEGGAITTNNPDWAAWFDKKLNHGASGMKGPGLDFVDYGYNFRLPELQAVMARKQLPKLPAIVAERNTIRDQFVDRLEPLGFTAQKIGKNAVSNIQSLVFTVPAGMNRDGLIAHLKSEGVESTIGTYCLSGTTYYARKYADVQPIAQKLFDTTITLPCYSGVDVDFICDKIAAFSRPNMAPKAVGCCA